MKCYWLVLSGVCVAGCMANNGLQYEAASGTNLYHIARLRKGMSEKEALQIMHKPYSYESFEVADDIYDVWFYVTKPTGLAQTRMVAQNLTPLTFKNGILVGTGYYWYYYAMKEQAEEVAAQNPQPKKPKTQEESDREFEETLDAEKKHPSAAQDSEPANPAQESASTTTPRSTRLASIIKPWKSAPPLAAANLFSKIRMGMSETEVMNLLGAPSKHETFQLDRDVYDVWIYEILSSKKKAPPQDVPLTFKNEVLVSMEVGYYNKIRKAAEKDQTNGYDEKGERMQEDESEQNFNFW